MTTQARAIAFWRKFYADWDTGMIASHFECREHEVWNVLGRTRGTYIQAKAKEIDKEQDT